MRYLPYYILLILAVLFIAPKMKHAIKAEKDVTVVTVVIDNINTSAFREGQIVVFDDYVRLACPRDSSSRILGVVTKCGIMGEITIKYIPNE